MTGIRTLGVCGAGGTMGAGIAVAAAYAPARRAAVAAARSKP